MSLALISSEYCSDEESEVEVNCELDDLPNSFQTNTISVLNINQSSANEENNKTYNEKNKLEDSDNSIEKQTAENHPPQIANSTLASSTKSSDNATFKCPYCPEAYNSLDSLLKHILLHAGITWDKLKHLPADKQRNQTSSRKSKWKNHVSCAICSRILRSDFMLAHVFSHTDKAPFECFICKVRYRSLDTVKKHMKRKHKKLVPSTSYNLLLAKYTGSVSPITVKATSVNGTFKCPYCPDAYKTLITLLQHLLVHAGIIWDNLKHFPAPQKMNQNSSVKKNRQYVGCAICGKLYRSDRLVRHVLSHTDLTPFECFICNKRFKSMNTVKAHLNDIHGNLVFSSSVKQLLAKYACSVSAKMKTRPCSVILTRCDDPNTFQHQRGTEIISNENIEKPSGRTVTSLRRHSVIPMGKKRFKCETCGKGFGKNDALSEHVKLHLSRKRYKCDYCPGTFANKRNLQRHMKKHTKDYRYHCKICSKSFYRKDLHDNHVQHNHSKTCKKVCE